MKKLLGAGLAATAAVPVGMAAALAGVVGAHRPSAEAAADIPSALLGTYLRSAASCQGLSWAVLAAVAKVESDHGRIGGARMTHDGEVRPHIVGLALDGSGGTAAVADTDGGRLDGDAVWDRAVGPMQFLPSTWARWGRDATRDRRADPHNAFDAAAAAAAYLCGPEGQVDDPAEALRRYNRSEAYVAQVLGIAEAYGGGAGVTSAAGLLVHPGLVLSAPARDDLQSGLVDSRLVAVLGAAAGRFQLGVGVIRTGHAQCVGGGSRSERPTCSVSNHWHYRGVDITAVGGRPVSATNAEARALAEWLLRLPEDLRPDEVGLPWAALDPLPRAFSDAAHQGHLHLGWNAAPGRPRSTPINKGESP